MAWLVMVDQIIPKVSYTSTARQIHSVKLATSVRIHYKLFTKHTGMYPTPSSLH
uniref:Uncharacterized protein n=1 Tax=Anguilla anguilla TaxID=7936 RepID=A0A0E9X1B7_ANGAN